MCGLLGFIDYNKKISKVNFDIAIDTMEKRGPDARGADIQSLSNCNIGLGHRRLSILDLDARSNQPFFDDDLGLIFNGEIYNFNAIKNELIDLKHDFHTTSDTEVILKAYKEWGTGCFTKFLGMFSIVIHDKSNNEVILVRDRLGVKPLYLYHKDDLLIFGSETKAIVNLLGGKPEINESALHGFFALGYVPGNESIFKNIYKIKPGTISTINLDKSRKVVTTEFWNIENYIEKGAVKDDDEECLSEILEDAVRLRLVADVEVGSYLSGGLDSSYITKLLAETHKGPLKSFTIGFTEKFNEAPHAKKVADFIKTNHKEYYLNPENISEILKNYSTYFDEPFSDDAGIPMLYLSQKSKENVKVVISSDGGDEAFAGYSRYIKALKYHNKLRKIPGIIRVATKIICFLIYKFTPKRTKFNNFFWRLKNILNKDMTVQLSNLLYFGDLIPEPELKYLLDKNILKTKFNHAYNVKKTKNFSALKQILSIDINERLVNQMLVKVDKSTMGASIEGREPLLDHRLFEFMFSSADENFIKDGTTKYLFRKIINKKFNNSEILNKPKMGFNTPVLKWLKVNYADYVESEIKSISKLNIPYLNQANLLTYWDEYKKGKVYYQALLWRSLIYIQWYKTYMV